MEWLPLFLLLPVAALSGWLIGRRRSNIERRACGDFNSNYFKGLNYLLNEQSDKAIEVFVQMLEVDSETVDTHFALGNLFLRRGEVDRAIRIHQNLIARPTLTRLQRQQALFELGKDYMRAGLLDRAESLFIQAADNSELAPLALRHLLEVYQQEREWQKAIDVAFKLKGSKESREMGPMIAHFLCESAEEELRRNRSSEAIRLVKMALDEDKGCVRATLLEAQMEMARGDYRKSIRILHRVEDQDPGYLPEILMPLQECHRRLGSEEELLIYLDRLIKQQQGGSSFVLLQAELIRIKQGIDEAISVLLRYLTQHPSLQVMNKVIEWKVQNHDIDASNDLVRLNQIISSRLDNRPAYQCRNCGFASRTLNWHCPTCKQWNTVKPLLASEGE